ncbi:hypothetical protein GCM10023091_14190 [Ravibacter arvi]|uniref:Uncharacterized protein n=1 Tax=Ravibacter arvi TaxID=2051041 RepID=A0ABP8LU92_9BACT
MDLACGAYILKASSRSGPIPNPDAAQATGNIEGVYTPFISGALGLALQRQKYLQKMKIKRAAATAGRA